MKKMFLSLAVLGMISLGAVSCGSDDGGNNGGNNGGIDGGGGDNGGGDNGGGDNGGGGTETNVFTWGGNSYDLDTTTTGVIVNSENQMIAYNIGTEAEPLLATRWLIFAHEGTDWRTADDAVLNQIFVLVDGNTVIWPADASNDEIYLLTTEVVVGGELVADPDGITAFSLTINDWDDEGESIDYATSTTFAEGVVSLNYNEFMDGPYGFTITSEESNSLKSVSNATKLTNFKVNTTNVQKIDSKNLVRLVK